MVIFPFISSNVPKVTSSWSREVSDAPECEELRTFKLSEVRRAQVKIKVEKPRSHNK